MAYWTIEEVADFLDITVGKVYDSRKRKEYPGILGKQRGRRLMFDQALIEAGPQPDPHTTHDVTTAILWTLQGIHKTLARIERNTRPTTGHWVTGPSGGSGGITLTGGSSTIEGNNFIEEEE